MRKLALLLLFCSAAYAQEQLGTIVFPNSGKPEAQAAFLHGVLLLHNFAYPQAEKAFVEAEKIDPNFVLAYWGEAMTFNHPIWQQVDVEAGRRVLERVRQLLASTTPRERGYVEALEALYGPGDKPQRDKAYEQAMEKLAHAYPDDVEAQVFWALSILGTRPRGDSDPRTAIQAAAILENLFPTHPDHPGVLHYLIHAYDSPLLAPLGLRPALRYAKVASGAPHALHMPSHIFVQLGMWEDAAKSNEAAFALSKQWNQPDYHSLQWLQYAYLQLHRDADAKRLIDDVTNNDAVRENMRIRYAVETGAWTDFQFTSPYGQAMRAIAEKHFDDARHAIAAFRGNDAEREELLASLAAARGQMPAALRHAQAAVVAEDKMGVPSGPPEDFKPANELYGELLLEARQPKEALEQFRISLQRTPNRAASVAGERRAEEMVTSGASGKSTSSALRQSSAGPSRRSAGSARPPGGAAREIAPDSRGRAI